MKHKQKVTLSYAYENVQSNDIIKLLKLFYTKNVFIEITNIRIDSDFCKSIQMNQNKYILFQNSPSGTYMDIIISECIDEKFTNTLDEIIDSHPELLLLYLTDLPFENFLYCKSKITNDKIIKKQVCSCVFEIMFDENAFLISFNSRLFYQPDLMCKINQIFMETYK